MNNKLVIGIAAIAIVLIGIYVFYNIGPTVSAQGNSALKVQPDEISVYLSIETRNLTAQGAQAANSEIRESVVSSLLGLGIDNKDIQFASYNINQDYDWSSGKQVLKGYVAVQQIVIKTKDFGKVPGIVDKSVESGALVTYINFEISDEKQREYKNKALEAASGDAREKAASTAKGLGKNLGRLISVSAQDFYYQPQVYYDRAIAADAEFGAQKAALNLAPQDIEVTASISVEYKLSLF